MEYDATVQTLVEVARSVANRHEFMDRQSIEVVVK